MKIFLKSGQIVLLAVFLLLAISITIFGMYNFSKTGTIFSNSKYTRVELVELLSFGNFYSGKEICTRGYYVKNNRLSIIRVNLEEAELTRSIWIKTPKEDIITNILGTTRYVEAEVCGFFESKRDGEFGDPPVWHHQITAEKYKLHSKFAEIKIQ